MFHVHPIYPEHLSSKHQECNIGVAKMGTGRSHHQILLNVEEMCTTRTMLLQIVLYSFQLRHLSQLFRVEECREFCSQAIGFEKGRLLSHETEGNLWK